MKYDRVLHFQVFNLNFNQAKPGFKKFIFLFLALSLKSFLEITRSAIVARKEFS